MDKEKQIINMLNCSEKLVGSKQVLKGLSEGIIRCVFIAEDTESELKAKLVAAAVSKNAEVFTAPSMEWLGKQAGIEVRAATVGLTAVLED